jgi:hypothetical protein
MTSAACGETQNGASPESFEFQDPHLDVLTRLEGGMLIPKPLSPPYYHYTSMAGLEGILKDGRIKTCPWEEEDRLFENDFEPTYTFICDVAWVSAAPVWESAATASQEFAIDFGYGIDDFVNGESPPVARIKVRANILFEWSSYLFATGTSCQDLLRLLDRADEIGSTPADWAVCPRPITCSDWLAVDVWNGEDWIPIESSKDSELQRLAAMVPMHCFFDTREGFSAAKAWLDDIRSKGGDEWIDFLRYKNILLTEARKHDYALTLEEIEETLIEDDYIHPLFRILLAIQHLPDAGASRVAATAGSDAIEILQGNQLFAHAVEKYCGLDLQTLIQTIRRFMSPMPTAIVTPGNLRLDEKCVR